MSEGGGARAWHMDTPAKLNLGLEILGRRSDGFHEIRTIMQTISLVDTVRVRTTADDSVRLGHLAFEPSELRRDDTGLTGDANLAVRAARAIADEAGSNVGLRVDLRKRIPTASGLGGASSDAAAALALSRLLLAPDLPDAVLQHQAAALGSDVPFLLDGGTALVEGRGERVTPLPILPETWFVVVFPLRLPPVANKTRTLYGALRPDDIGATGHVAAQIERIRQDAPLDPALLGNAFARAMAEVWPDIADLRREIERQTGQVPVPSGAGPAHYLTFADRKDAGRATGNLNAALAGRALVWLVEPLFSV